MAQTFDFDIGSVVGPPGATGNGISGIELLSTSGLQKTYRINMTNETHFDFVVTDGNGISGASFDADTNELTITFDNGTSFTTPSLKGNPGDNGYSPAVTIDTITGGHRVTITDKDHPTGQSFDVMDGASDAGSVSYDPSATYQSGTVGAELQHQSRQLSDKQDAPSTAGTAGQVLSLDNQLNPVWSTPSGGGGGGDAQMELIKVVELDSDAQSIVVDTDDSSASFNLGSFALLVKSVGASDATAEGYLKICLNSNNHRTNRIADIVAGIRISGSFTSIAVAAHCFDGFGSFGNIVKQDVFDLIYSDGSFSEIRAYNASFGAFVSPVQSITSIFVGTDNANVKLGAGSVIALYGVRK